MSIGTKIRGTLMLYTQNLAIGVVGVLPSRYQGVCGVTLQP